MNAPDPRRPVPQQGSPRRWDTPLGRLRDGMIIGALAIYGLVSGARLLIPMAVALLLFTLLTAVIQWIASHKVMGRRVPGWLAHVLGVALVIAGIWAILQVFAGQATAVAQAIPRYEARLGQVITGFVAWIGEDAAAMLEQWLSTVNLSAIAMGAVNQAGAFLTGFFLVVLYVPFLMVESRRMSDKIAIAMGNSDLSDQVHDVIFAIARGLQRYVGIKTFVSALTGILCYMVMKPFGVDFAETWAVLAFALNFIPSIGSYIAIILPSVVALVQFDTLTPFLVILFGLGAVNFAIGNVLEPSLAGHTLNLSPLMVILSLTFWTMLWGIPGAFLSVPMTVCLVIIFAQVPATRPIAVLMSGRGRI